MDNLIGNSESNRSLPVFILVSVGNAAAGNDGEHTLRDVEYDTLSGKYAEFVSFEVLPAVRSNQNISLVFPKLRFTEDPDGRATFGCSSGGAASFTMAWFRPDLFRRVYAAHASLVLKDEFLSSNTTYPAGGSEYPQLIRTSKKKPLRIFHSGGQHDLGTNDSQGYVGTTLTGTQFTHEGCVGNFRQKPFIVPICPTHQHQNGCVTPEPHGFDNWCLGNNRTADALKANGYEHRYAYARGACHCDMQVVLQDMPNSLVWLWHGWAQTRFSDILV